MDRIHFIYRPNVGSAFELRAMRLAVKRQHAIGCLARTTRMDDHRPEYLPLVILFLAIVNHRKEWPDNGGRVPLWRAHGHEGRKRSTRPFGIVRANAVGLIEIKRSHDEFRIVSRHG